MSANVIPFVKPRAIASMPATFSAPVPNTPIPSVASGSRPNAAPAAPATSWNKPAPAPAPVASSVPVVPSSWGSAAVAAQPVVAPPTRFPQASTPPPVAQHAVIPTVNPVAPTVMAPPPIQEPVPAVSTVAPSRWAAFEKLGLGAPKIDHKKLNKHIVNAYRALGFIILTIIVIALVGYLVTTAFFYMSDSWVVPMAISPTDEKVVSLQSQLSERQTNRDRTAADLDQAERAIVVQQEFQAQFAKAIKSDLEGRKAALAKMYELASAAASTRAQIKRSNSAYATASQKRMAEEWRAGLIDRNSMLNGKFQIAQISSSNLNLAERQAEYETRAADLESQTRSLEALLSDAATDGTLSYDVLRIKQEYEASRLETQRAIENRDMLKAALEREDKLLAALKQSSYLKAMADNAHVAFVPYGNLSNVKKGEPLYGCALTMVFCKKVGTVLEVLPGEVVSKHPNRDKMLRGQMVEIKLENGSSATDEVLFVGGRPLFS
ncbi:MAG: hypothetical protein HOV81_30785 [Kofleriaceae bacterium]|nr:hypothetical protein [Kofleriaceae bacterium]